MGVTRQIPRKEWEEYFKRYTRQHLAGESDAEGEVHPAAVVEALSPAFGDQVEATLVPLVGMAFDPKSNAFELLLKDVDHLVFDPIEIWVIEEDGGFISALEILQADGVKEIVQLRRSGPPALRYEAPAPPEG
jgi:hypothetical protein